MDEAAYHPGLEGIIAGETSISTVTDGLRYRGYAIEELAANGTFEEAAYLLLRGDLPSAQELQSFRRRLTESMQVPSELHEILGRLPHESSMMDVLRSGVSLLALWDPGAQSHDPAAEVAKAERLLAQLPVVLGASYRLRAGHVPAVPADGLPFAGNVLRLLTGVAPTDRAARALDVTLILYAEHEFNASAFTARVVTSTLSDLHSAIIAAIGALKGPLHGGANERVMDTLQQVGSPDQAEQWVRDALARKERIMGFGHRVYKTGDPRARYLKPLCRELAEETGNESIEEMADVMERVVMEEKGLPPNVDWPTARLYHYLGLPVELYTPLFVLSRVTGWSAHVIEQRGANRLIRPRARYAGPEPREWVPLEARP